MNINELAILLNQLRVEQGMKPLANPKKLGIAKLKERVEELQELVKPGLIDASEQEQEEITAWANKEGVEEIKATVPSLDERSIKEVSCELLCEVVGVNEEGRTLGAPYQEVLDKILLLRPEANTSLNCLRWYAGKIRVLANGYQGYKLPQIRLRTQKS